MMRKEQTKAKGKGRFAFCLDHTSGAEAAEKTHRIFILRAKSEYPAAVFTADYCDRSGVTHR
jgi:hypothetical protein